MATLQHQENPESRTEPMGCMPLLLRLTWMAFGNVALLISAGLIAKGTAPVVMDSIFFLVAIGLIVVRYVDITKFKGQTSEGQPASLLHWRRYVVLMAVISASLWALARVVCSFKWL